MHPFSPLILILAVLAGCTGDAARNEGDNAVNNVAAIEPASTPALPSVAEPLSRRELLLAAGEAASDYSAGVDNTAEQRELDGRPFSFAIRLCEGETAGTAFRSSFDEESRVLRLEVRPDIEATSLPIRQLSNPQFEAVEGFWVRKPWMLDPACPIAAPVMPSAEQPAAGGAERPAPEAERTQTLPSVGIAEFHDAGSDRSSRRDKRPYEVTKRLPDGERPGVVDLLIEGRLRALPAGRVVVCTGGSPVAPPTCIISVRIDNVSLRQPGGDILGQWSST